MREWIVDAADAGMRLDKWIATRTDAASRARAAAWLARGKVFVGGQSVDTRAGGRAVSTGDRIGIWIDRPGTASVAARALRDARPLLHVIHEDDAIVVLDKPAGLLVEPLPGRSGQEPTLLDLIADRDRHSLRARAYVVHRIDRDTSGLVLFARTRPAQEILKEQFEERTPERVYAAVVLGWPSPESGTWRDSLAWDAKSLRQRRAHGRDARGKDAEARYRIVETFAVASLLEISLVTGKRNQIRVQAAMRGHPVLGERQYRFGAPPEPEGLPSIDRQALHASRLGFEHPTTHHQARFEAPLPKDFRTLLAGLRRTRERATPQRPA